MINLYCVHIANKRLELGTVRTVEITRIYPRDCGGEVYV